MQDGAKGRHADTGTRGEGKRAGFPRSISLASFCLLLATSLSGCAGGLQGLLPDDIQSLQISIFGNRTSQARIGQSLTDEVTKQFLADCILEIRNQGADATLRGTVVTYWLQPLIYNESHGVEQYKMVLGIDLDLVDNKTGETLWSEEKKETVEKFFTVYSGNPDARTEDDVREAIILEAAEKVAERVLRGWWIQEDY